MNRDCNQSRANASSEPYDPRQESGCRCCGHSEHVRLFAASDFDKGSPGYTLEQCHRCNLVRTGPVWSDGQLSDYYDTGYYGSGEKKFNRFMEAGLKRLHQLHAQFLVRRIREGQNGRRRGAERVLDIGCGRGLLLRELHRMGLECTGIERSDFPVDGAASQIRVHKAELQELAFKSGHFDAVVLWHVLEHICEPFDLLAEVARVMAPGGVLALAVPNFGSWQARRFGRHWFHLDLPRHRHHFTEVVLSQWLGENGFDLIAKDTRSIEQNTYGFIQSTLNQMTPEEKPNRLYGLLKKNGAGVDLRLLGWLTAAAAIAAPAAAEYLMTGLLGCGATLSIYARKRS